MSDYSFDTAKQLLKINTKLNFYLVRNTIIILFLKQTESGIFPIRVHSKQKIILQKKLQILGLKRQMLL